MERGNLIGSPGHPSSPWANAIAMLYSPLLHVVDVLDLERSEALRVYLDFFDVRF